MTHFAQIDADGTVMRVIVAEQGFIDSGAVGEPDSWIMTSYNGAFRGNFACLGGRYDRSTDRFVSPQPFPSWTHDGEDWRPPYPKPDGPHEWVETVLAWVIGYALKNQ